jgi:UDP-2,3-diacylglucosamine hydrolase
MDVNAAAVDAAMDAADATLLVHGHTHRPATHRWRAGGAERTRVVLTDWDAPAGRGALLRWEDGRAVA